MDTREKTGEHKYAFQKMTPITNADIEGYEEAIDFVFENDDVTNIALSGNYSSGKSSIIETYKAKHKEKKFIKLSLASFGESDDKHEKKINSVENNDPNKSDGTEVDSTEKEIEGKILNQLIHQIPAERIPQTSFKIKQLINPIELGVFAITLSIILFCVIGLFNKNYTVELITQSSLSFDFSKGEILTFLILITVSGTSFLLYQVIQMIKEKHIFKKINIQGNEIELFNEQQSSYFDKYMDEIVYLFERSGADAVIFEDMDRFNSSEIFERLREINIVVNLHKKVQFSKDQLASGMEKECTPIRFIYLIKDGLFSPNDRTKFFDFMIPVIPIIDGNSSSKAFTEYLKNTSGENIDPIFLQQVSVYIDDIRLMKTICNDFVIYEKRLRENNEQYNFCFKPEKLLAMMLYKNVFPYDFILLQHGRGFVYGFFQYEGAIIQHMLNNNQQDINRFSEEMEKSQQEMGHAGNEGELDRCNKRFNKYSEQIEKRKEFERLCKDESFLTLINRGDELKLIDWDRISCIDRESNGKIITDGNFYLLKYLILGGYIDNGYMNYMSYFKSGSLSLSDKKYLRAIFDKQAINPDVHLQNIEQIMRVGKFTEESFLRVELLNYDMLDYLFSKCTDKKYAAMIHNVIITLEKMSDYEFIKEYYSRNNKYRKLFVESIFSLTPNFLVELNAMKKKGEPWVKKFSLDMLYLCEGFIHELTDDEKKVETELLSELIDYQDLSDYIKDCEDEGKTVEQLIKGMKLFNLKIDITGPITHDEVLLKNIYREELYLPTVKNAVLIIGSLSEFDDVLNSDEIKGKFSCENDMYRKNYTLLGYLKNTELYKYVNENIDDYHYSVLDNYHKDIFEDDEEVIVRILNNENISPRMRKAYFRRIKEPNMDLSKIKDESFRGYLKTDEY